MEIEVLKMLPAYMIPSAVVVWLFYQMLQHRDATLEKITTGFSDRIETLDLAHRKQIESIVDRFSSMQQASSDSQKAVVNDYLKMTRETVVAMSNMANTQREFRNWIRERAEARRQTDPRPSEKVDTPEES